MRWQPFFRNEIVVGGALLRRPAGRNELRQQNSQRDAAEGSADYHRKHKIILLKSVT
jgi:hypothetical protein